MSDIKSILPLLEKFDMGDQISEHDGVCCYPAIIKNTQQQYIVKVISIPASKKQLDALLLAGAYANEEDALAYFQELVNDLEEEIQVLQRLSKLEGFLSFTDWETVQNTESTGYHICLLSEYHKTLAEHFERNPMTHLRAVNLGLDLCAALAVCRRAGYIFVDLKPSNVYILNEKDYRIGDLGFIRLDSLKYTSLPDKYRSEYTAPEIKDAFSALNTTLDVYAVGLILYQAYNNGILPVPQADGSYPPPDYADYEIAEIILKACAVDPADRWQDPLEMGQALISYMQRNSINDTPIVPISVPEETITSDTPVAEENTEIESDADVPEADSDDMGVQENEPSEYNDTDLADVPITTAAETPEQETSAESAPEVYTEDEFGNLAFLLEEKDETDPASNSDDIDYSELSDEVSAILAQADELAEHPVPEAVVAPDPVEVSLPDLTEEETPAEEPENQDAETDETSAETADEAETPAAEPETPAEAPAVALPAESEEEDDVEAATAVVPKRKFRGLGIILLVIALLALIAASVLYYQHFYLMPVDAIVLDGNQDSLVVTVDTKIDESLLTVICSDSHGNPITSPVVDGKATFENLVPNTAYNIKVVVSGFHKLTGTTATGYSTPAQTNIVQFNAVTGAEDGSVILGFTVDGPDASEWTITYQADGEAAKTVTSPAHMVTLSGLTIGKSYTFTLAPSTDLYVTGITETTFTAAKLVYAQNVRIIGFADGNLTATWDVPEGVTVANWTARCYNDSGYNESLITSENTVQFEGLDHNSDYTLEVTAAGMSVSERIFIPKNAFTATNFQASASGANNMVVTWETAQEVPNGGWLLTYTIDNNEKQYTVTCNENRAEIINKIPGATYTFALQGTDGAVALTAPFVYEVPAAESFSGYNVTADNMTTKLYKVPGIVYTNQFKPSDSIYMLIRLNKKATSSSDSISILYVIRDADGNVISQDSTRLLWRNLWTNNECILAIPNTPEDAGQYTLSVYFNGAVISEHAITVES